MINYTRYTNFPLLRNLVLRPWGRFKLSLKSLLVVGLVIVIGDGIAQQDSIVEHPTLEFPEPATETQRLEEAYNFVRAKQSLLNKRVAGNWQELGPFQFPEGNSVRQVGVGRLNSITFHPHKPNVLFVCGPSGGLFYSEDGGTLWKNGGTDFLPVTGASWCIPHPIDPKTWILSTGDGDGTWSFSTGVYITRDKGKTWKLMSDGLPKPVAAWDYVQYHKLISNPNNYNQVFAATNKGLYRTNNAFANHPVWEEVWGGERINDLEFRPGNSNYILAGGKAIILSTNGGKSFTKLPGTGFANIGYNDVRINIEMSPADPKMIYIAVSGKQKKKGTYKARVYRYHESRGTWKFRGNISDNSYLPFGLIPARVKAFTVSPTDANVLLAGNVNPIWRSEDGGETWNKLKVGVHDDIHHLDFSPTGELWATTDGGVYKSTDVGDSWENRTVGIGIASIHGVSSSSKKANLLVIGCYDTGSSLLDRKTGTWRNVSGGDGYCNLFAHGHDSTFYTTAVGGAVWRFELEKGTYKKKGSAGAPRSGSGWPTWVVMHPQNDELLYQCGTSLWRNPAKGFRNSWESVLDIKTQFPQYKIALKAFIDHQQGETIYATLLGKRPYGIARTFDGNKSADQMQWELVDHPLDHHIAELAIDPANPQAFWLTYERVAEGFYDKVWYYNGKRWKSKAFDLPEFAKVFSIKNDLTHPGRVYIGTDVGIFYNDPKSRNWILVEGLPHTKIRSFIFDYGSQKIIVGTFGRGVWEGDLPQ